MARFVEELFSGQNSVAQFEILCYKTSRHSNVALVGPGGPAL